MKLKPLALGLAGGILWGVGLCVGTLWIVIIGSPGITLGLLGKFYIGYSVTIPGAFIGLVWGFVDGFICGIILAWLYNLFIPSGQES